MKGKPKFIHGQEVPKGVFKCPVCGYINTVAGKTEIRRTQFTRYMKEVTYPQYDTPEYIEYGYVTGFNQEPVLISYAYQYLIPTGQNSWHFHWIPRNEAVVSIKELGR